jgi:septum formation protein
MSTATLIEESTDDATAIGVRVVLASRSPRRTELLREADIDHDAQHPGFDDASLVPGDVTPEQWVMSLAFLKAWARATDPAQAEPRLVVGADTACLVDGRLVGTPTTAGEAREMLQGMLGREHDVITGVAVICTATGRRRMFADRATVRMGHLDAPELEAYIASGLWKGKAGAYNLSERLDAGWPITYEGDPATIMGLPVTRLRPVLAALAQPPQEAA